MIEMYDGLMTSATFSLPKADDFETGAFEASTTVDSERSEKKTEDSNSGAFGDFDAPVGGQQSGEDSEFGNFGETSPKTSKKEGE